MLETFYIVSHATRSGTQVQADLSKEKELERLREIAKRMGRRWTIFNVNKHELVDSYNQSSKRGV